MKEYGVWHVVAIVVIGYLGAKFAYPVLDTLWKASIGKVLGI